MKHTPQPSDPGERFVANIILASCLALFVAITTFPFWFLGEAIIYRSIRGHRGRWVGLAVEPGYFWLLVAMSAFYAASFALLWIWGCRAFLREGGWRGAVSRIAERMGYDLN